MLLKNREVKIFIYFKYSDYIIRIILFLTNIFVLTPTFSDINKTIHNACPEEVARTIQKRS